MLSAPLVSIHVAARPSTGLLKPGFQNRVSISTIRLGLRPHRRWPNKASYARDATADRRKNHEDMMASVRMGGLLPTLGGRGRGGQDPSIPTASETCRS